MEYKNVSKSIPETMDVLYIRTKLSNTPTPNDDDIYIKLSTNNQKLVNEYTKAVTFNEMKVTNKPSFRIFGGDSIYMEIANPDYATYKLEVFLIGRNTDGRLRVLKISDVK